MASLFRRAGAAIARIFQSATDPAAETDVVQLYAKDDGGVSQLFARSDDGTVHQITPAAQGAVIFDDSVPGADVNIRSDRASNQSPIDNTKVQITNLGSADGTQYPLAASTGATGIAATIGGGNDNAAVGNYSTVGGGAGNWTDGLGATIPGGQYNYVLGDYGHAEGYGCNVLANYGHAEGNGAFIDTGSIAAHAEGTSSIGTNAARSHAESASLIDNNSTDCHAEGSGHVDDGCTFSHAEGRATIVGPNVEAGHVEGWNNSVLESYGHAEGAGNQVSAGAFYAHAEGDSNIAAGLAAHAEGSHTQANGNYSHAQGDSSVATGAASHAEGKATTATGAYSHAEGYVTIATGEGSHASGQLSNALREGQWSHASGSDQGFAIDEGNKQASLIVMRGETSGIAINETIDLGFGKADPPTTTTIILENDKVYDFEVLAVIGGRQAGPVQVTKTIKLNFNARCVAGVATIAASGMSDSYGDAATATWTLTQAAVGNAIKLTFGSGAGTISKCFIGASVRFTEARFQPT